MMNRFYPVIICLCFWSLTSCEKEDPTPPFSIIPEIRLMGISKDTVFQFTDSLDIFIAYRDGDGDLGHPDPDIPSVIVKDARLALADSFHLQPLTPLDKSYSIEGELRIRMPQLFLLGNGQSETTRLRIKMIDRTGNESNEVQTPNITIIR